MPSADRIDELKKRYDENPRRFFASLANEYRKAGDLEQAISLCQSHLAEQPSNMNGHVVYGQALYEAGRFDEAKTTFETALTLDPENLIALRHLGDIACTNGANADARQWYVRVLDADPRNEEIIALLAHLDAEDAKKPAIDVPIASKESMAPREGRSEAFKPPKVITPIMDPTPVVPIASVDTITVPAVNSKPSAPPADSIGLMDLPIDFGADLSGAADAPAASGAGADHAIHDATGGAVSDVSSGLEDFSVDASFGTFAETPAATADDPAGPTLSASDEVPGGSDLIMDPFADSFAMEAEPAAPAEPPTAGAGAPRDVAEDLLFGDSAPPEPAAPFVTETMAELYLQQGFTAEALEVYRQLLAQFPNDENLQQRVRKLERGDRSSLSLDIVPEVPTGAPSDTASLGVPIGEMLDAPPAATTATPAAPPAQSTDLADVITTENPLVSSPRTARDWLSALASRRAARPERASHPVSNGTAAAAPPADAPHAAASHAATPPLSTATSGSLDALFGNGGIAEPDEQVARAFAQVAGAVEMGSATVKGKPTAPAATELSLDSVFHEGDSRPGSTVPRQSQNLKFDQFFSMSEGDPAPAQTQPPRHSAPMGEPGSPAELVQFQSWLQGLKKP